MSDNLASKYHSTRAAPPPRQVVHYLMIVSGVAAVLATVFTAWTPAIFEPGELVAQWIGALRGQEELSPTQVGTEEQLTTPSALKIGIVAGHSGPNPETGFIDPGATCADGLTELQVNQEVASLVVQGLNAAGYDAVQFQEFDARLSGYRAVALVSIHTDSCTYINDEATGYKVAAALDSAVPDRAQRLVACLADRYGRLTGMRFHPDSITRDMTEYHSFYEIHSQTPAAIIEIGFLYLDRDYLTKNTDEVARGIVEGVLCFVNNEPTSWPGEARP